MEEEQKKKEILRIEKEVWDMTKVIKQNQSNPVQVKKDLDRLQNLIKELQQYRKLSLHETIQLKVIIKMYKTISKVAKNFGTG